jgi:hypothetical protein
MSTCDDMQKIPLPRYLQGHKAEILHIFGNARGAAYDFNGWLGYFQSNPHVIQDLNIIKQQCPNTISRKDVRYFAHQARSGGYEELRRLFLACMIWGYGGDPNGPHNTKLALSDPRAVAVLQETVSRISNGQIKEAYDKFDLANCGPAFFTKLFYFMGKEYDAKPLPLILDSHVASFLDRLSRIESFDYSSLFVRTSPNGYVRRCSKGYLHYINSINDWAKMLGCPPDKIEYFMYCKDKECEQREEKEGIPKEGLIYKRDGAHCFYCNKLLASPPFDNINIKQIAKQHACKSPDRRILFL